MQPHSKTLLCRYHYDPLDRLVDCTLPGQEGARRFYQKDRLTTEIHGTVKRSIMQHDVQLLAQQQRHSDSVETSLLATNQQRSVVNVLDAPTPRPTAYAPYGHCPLATGLLSLLGFNGERQDPVTGCYLLGTGHHRPFNPVLGRFTSPDSWSPFGKGGVNGYAYCSGDPVNRWDPTGHSNFLISFIKGIGNRLKLRTPGRAPGNIAGGARTTGFRNPLAQPTNQPLASGQLAPNRQRPFIPYETPVIPGSSQGPDYLPDYLSTVMDGKPGPELPPPYVPALQMGRDHEAQLIQQAVDAAKMLDSNYKFLINMKHMTRSDLINAKRVFTENHKAIRKNLEYELNALTSSSSSSSSSSVRSSISSSSSF